LVVASLDGAFARQVSDSLAEAHFDVHRSTDITGVELAGTAKNAAVLAAAAAASAGPNVAGAAAGKVFAEVGAYARSRGARADTLAGLAGTGDLVASMLCSSSRNRRAGELIASGVPAGEVVSALGQSAEAIDAVPLLASALHDAGVPAPTVQGLADVIAGRVEPASWSQSITAPQRPARKMRAA
jgi:glycerol-3-phosphate dehydrogenase